MKLFFLLAFLMFSFPALAASGGYAGVIAPPLEDDAGGDETPTYYSFAPRTPSPSPVLKKEEKEEEAALAKALEAPVNTVLPPALGGAGKSGLDQRRQDIQKIISDRKLSDSQKIGHLNAERDRLQQEKIQKALLDAQLQYQKLQKRKTKK